MSKFELQGATDEYLSAHMPDHECEGECERGEGFFLLVHVDKNDVIHRTYGVHHLDPASAIQAFVGAMDEQFVRNRPEGMPAALAFAQGRELLKKAAENIEPPAEISQGFDEFLRNLAEGLLGGNDE